MTGNKRKSTRVDAGFEAYVTVGDVVIPVATKNISLKGALLEGCDDCLVGTKAELHIPLSPAVRIVTEGEILRAANNETAMIFSEMDELSFTFLHRLVQLNTKDPDAVNEELMEIFEKL
ncbi:PilZ domain-containing protein [Pseudodesulfovibrio piezophilus]|uniref:Type IV pilus assembly PilZ n=1 Tax=Pseudodesulfovibrio piezophilus (strain DSM 21447 / JCM 15486 / C1TLV30) TaxID=1322246 RepID=M1WTM2_PSEP2|nr:PilZ domain-containing protein [Pseudodesulfovibrio piezophilus]CCH49742.1 Type IV pilus assembly PilZ [Pseudodesulfovibrio piezophilus C1TLV30]